jgi:hypothetical protein
MATTLVDPFITRAPAPHHSDAIERIERSNQKRQPVGRRASSDLSYDTSRRRSRACGAIRTSRRRRVGCMARRPVYPRHWGLLDNHDHPDGRTRRKCSA